MVWHYALDPGTPISRFGPRQKRKSRVDVDEQDNGDVVSKRMRAFMLSDVIVYLAISYLTSSSLLFLL